MYPPKNTILFFIFDFVQLQHFFTEFIKYVHVIQYTSLFYS